MEAQWVQNESGFLELIDTKTGEVIARERRRHAPRLSHSERGVGRPRNAEVITLRPRQAPRMPRLHEFDAGIAEEICNSVVEGALLTRIGPSLGIPYRAICRWRHENESFDRRVREALGCRALFFEEKALEIAGTVQHADEVPGARLRFDALKWATAVSDPVRYANCGHKRRENDVPKSG